MVKNFGSRARSDAWELLLQLAQQLAPDFLTAAAPFDSVKIQVSGSGRSHVGELTEKVSLRSGGRSSG
jgi:hypothetical protein